MQTFVICHTLAELARDICRRGGRRGLIGSSAFAFRGKDQDIRRIADALSVGTVLEGSVRRAGKRIRVTAQLISAEDGYHLWSERFDRELTDVFAIQDEIAEAIAGALQVGLGARPSQHTPNLPAYEASLRGAATRSGSRRTRSSEPGRVLNWRRLWTLRTPTLTRSWL